MWIYLNNKKINICNNTRLIDFLKDMKKEGVHFAVMLNKTFLSKKHHENYFLKEGDQIDMIEPMQGG